MPVCGEVAKSTSDSVYPSLSPVLSSSASCTMLAGYLRVSELVLFYYQTECITINNKVFKRNKQWDEISTRNTNRVTDPGVWGFQRKQK